MHPPFSRGVTQLMYVGDDAAPSSSALRSPVFWLGALAVGGGYLGLKKRDRKVAGVLAVACFLAL